MNFPKISMCESVALAVSDCYDRVTISMPTSPPGVVCFYAVNKLGAIASMIHPLSTESEIEFYCKVSKSRFALTMDMWLNTFAPAARRAGVEKLLICCGIWRNCTG